MHWVELAGVQCQLRNWVKGGVVYVDRRLTSKITCITCILRRLTSKITCMTCILRRLKSKITSATSKDCDWLSYEHTIMS